jgi:hypothetical protein
MVTTISFATSRKVETKVEVKKVFVKRSFKISEIEQMLLAQEAGVATAWIDKIGGVRTDCFATNILDDGQSIFSYCKLKKPLTPVTE